MGILTNRQSATSFSSYVGAFGLALLITSIVYLRRLDSSAELACADDFSIESSGVAPDFPTCSQIRSWRPAAIVGIIIGVIDSLMIFLSCCLCCTACFALCGCAMCCACNGCPDVFVDDPNKTSTGVTRNVDTEQHAETTTINVDTNDRPKYTTKYDVQTEPSKLHRLFDALGWILWVLGPFVATLFITISLYKNNAIRTSNDQLFNAALALFIIALFNLMVYFQKFVNSVCGYGHEQVANNAK